MLLFLNLILRIAGLVVSLNFSAALNGGPKTVGVKNVKIGILEASSSGNPSHLLAKRRPGERYPAKTALSITGYHDKPLNIHLELDTDFVAKDIKFLDHNADANFTYAGTIPRHLFCYYRGKVENQDDSFVTLNMCDSPRGRIEVSGAEAMNLHLEPADALNADLYTHRITAHKAPITRRPASRLRRRDKLPQTVLVAKVLLAIDIDHVVVQGPWLMGTILAFMHASSTYFPGGVVPVHDSVAVKVQFTHIVRAKNRQLVPEAKRLWASLMHFKAFVDKKFTGIVNMATLLRRKYLPEDPAAAYTLLQPNTCKKVKISTVYGDINEHTASKFSHELLHMMGADHQNDENPRSSTDTCRASEDVFSDQMFLNNLSECTKNDLRRAYKNGRFACFKTLQETPMPQAITAIDSEGTGAPYSANFTPQFLNALVYDENLTEAVQPLKWARVAHGLFKNYMVRFFNTWNFNLGQYTAWLTGFSTPRNENAVFAFKNSEALYSKLPIPDSDGILNSPSTINVDVGDHYKHRNENPNPVLMSKANPEFSDNNGISLIPKENSVDFERHQRVFKEYETKRRALHHRGEPLDKYPILLQDSKYYRGHKSERNTSPPSFTDQKQTTPSTIHFPSASSQTTTTTTKKESTIASTKNLDENRVPNAASLNASAEARPRQNFGAKSFKRQSNRAPRKNKWKPSSPSREILLSVQSKRLVKSTKKDSN